MTFRKRRSRDGNASRAEKSPVSAYVAALHMLSRRELSEKQLHQRLIRRGYALPEVGEAIDRLKTERAIDDERVARAIARSQVSIRRRGPLRVRREIEQAGIAGDAVRAAVDAAFGDVDPEALLESVLERKMKGRPIEDDRAFNRLYRYLVTQGFESAKVLKALNAKRRDSAE